MNRRDNLTDRLRIAAAPVIDPDLRGAIPGRERRSDRGQEGKIDRLSHATGFDESGLTTANFAQLTFGKSGPVYYIPPRRD